MERTGCVKGTEGLPEGERPKHCERYRDRRTVSAISPFPESDRFVQISPTGSRCHYGTRLCISPSTNKMFVFCIAG